MSGTLRGSHRPHQLEPLYQRLKELGNTDTTAAEDTVEILTGMQSDAGKWSYRERRKDMLLALLDQHADQFDDAIDELGKIVDHLRHVGIRGFVAEHTHDDDFTYKPDPAPAPRPPPRTKQHQTPPPTSRRNQEAPHDKDPGMSRRGTLRRRCSSCGATM